MSAVRATNKAVREAAAQHRHSQHWLRRETNSWLALAMTGLVLTIAAGGCGGKPAPTPPGAEQSTPAPEIDLGNSSDSPAETGGADKSSGAAAGQTEDSGQDQGPDTEKDK